VDVRRFATFRGQPLYWTFGRKGLNEPIEKSRKLDGLKLNGTQELQMYAYAVNLMGENKYCKGKQKLCWLPERRLVWQ
jgi:hypothetical protein